MSKTNLKIKAIDKSNLSPNSFLDLLESKIDLIEVSDFITNEECFNIKEDLAKNNNESKQISLDLNDGYFFPYPYSSIRQDHGSSDAAIEKYIKTNSHFKNLYLPAAGSALAKLIDLLEKKSNAKLLKLPHKFEMAPLNCRILLAQKNGIDIHCENAFLNQLDATFKKDMCNLVDLENAISIFIMIQAPEEGGELVLFDKDWKNSPININHTSYEERHDIEGSIFTNRFYSKPTKIMVKQKEKSATIFRAASIWHSINFIKGNEDRITIGCFFAKGKDGKIYYWA